MLVCDRALSIRRRTLLISKVGLTRRILALSLVRDSTTEGLKGKLYASDEEGKSAVSKKSLKEHSTKFHVARIHVLIRKGDIVIERNGDEFESKDMIHRGPASFWHMIHDPVSVIIPVLKKKALLFIPPPRILMLKNTFSFLRKDYFQLSTSKTCQRRWIIGRSGERGSGISVLAARHDDDDDILLYAYIYMHIYMYIEVVYVSILWADFHFRVFI